MINDRCRVLLPRRYGSTLSLFVLFPRACEEPSLTPCCIHRWHSAGWVEVCQPQATALPPVTAKCRPWGHGSPRTLAVATSVQPRAPGSRERAAETREQPHRTSPQPKHAAQHLSSGRARGLVGTGPAARRELTEPVPQPVPRGSPPVPRAVPQLCPPSLGLPGARGRGAAGARAPSLAQGSASCPGRAQTRCIRTPGARGAGPGGC